MRRNPITTLVGHLAWTRTGTVWATWRIKPLPYGYRPVGEKRSVRDLHRALWRAQHGEALVLGLCATQDPVTVVERMIAGVDLDACPEWAAECEATLDTLEGLHLGERTHWLSLPLANHGRARLSEPGRAALDGVRDVAALPRFRPAADVIAARRQQAQMLADAVPAVFQPVPAAVAEQVWIAGHLQRRGMVDLPVPADSVTAELLTPRNGLALPEPVLDEGGQTDVDRRARRRLNPLDRRYLKVADPQQPDEPASYQCLMAVADVPAGGMTFPGSEYLGRLDECGEDVDYALRLKVNSRAKVLKRNRRAVTELNDQYEQREGQLTTGQHELDYAGKLLTEYQEIFANDELEVEVEHTAVLAVGDTDPDRAQASAKAVVRYLRNLEFKLDRPVGGMEELWWAMHVGAPTSRLVRQYAQFTTASDFAAAVPFVTTRLGDRHGPIAALNTSTARLDVVHHDPAGHPALDISASFAFAGELGAGKSFGMKALAGPVVDRGGQLLAVDRTKEGEWAVFAEPLPSRTIVEVLEPRWSMDPLRVFGPAVGSRIAQAFVTVACDVLPQSEMGDVTAEVLDPQYLAEHNLVSLGGVVRHLAEDCALDGARGLARRLRRFANLDLGRVVFEPDLPPVDLSSSAIVWRTNSLELPTRDELTSEHLFRQMRLEKVFGRGYYTLVTSAARAAAFADRARFSLFTCDEAYYVTSSPESERDVALFVREGRRANAAVGLGSHDPEEDFGSETLRGLMPVRFLMRHRSDVLARRGLVWLGIDPEDPLFAPLLKRLTEDTSPVSPDGGVPLERRGEGFMRDAFGGIGPIKILGPSRPARFAAALTSPTSAQRGG